MCDDRSRVIVASCILLAVVLSTSQAQITGGGTANYISKFTGSTSIGNSVVYDASGLIGIGTTSPSYKLHVNSGVDNAPLMLQSTDPTVALCLKDNTTSFYGMALVRTGDNLELRTQDAARLTILPTGQVGIGTASPSYTLHVNSGVDNAPLMLQSTDQTVVMCLKDDTTSLYGMALVRTGDTLDLRTQDQARITITGAGNVGIGTTSPSRALTVRGNILVERSNGTSVIELGEGLDYAEGFDVTDRNAAEPGTVLVIDADSPGQLAVSTKPYDTRVAGIVAGARGLGSGVRLGVDQFDCDVALAGRVYCNVDATECAVQPGDLLTTSATAGHAMKAVDFDLAKGAILGKAMQSLEKGQKGQMLVLVTLQ